MSQELHLDQRKWRTAFVRINPGEWIPPSIKSGWPQGSYPTSATILPLGAGTQLEVRCDLLGAQGNSVRQGLGIYKLKKGGPLRASRMTG